MSNETTEPGYSRFLSLVSFVSSITFSLATASAQQFATSQSLFGATIQPNNDPLNRVQNASKFFGWGASVSAASLMLALVLQLITTDNKLIAYDISNSGLVVRYVRWGSWLALLLVGTGLGLMGEGLRAIHPGPGKMIEWSILAIGLPTLLLYVKLRHEAKRAINMSHPHNTHPTVP